MYTYFLHDVGTHDYLCKEIDGGLWLASYYCLSEDTPPFFPQVFENEADCILRLTGLQRRSLTPATAESLYRLLISLLI